MAEIEHFSLLDDPALDCAPRGMPRYTSWPYAQYWRDTEAGIAVTAEHSIETRLLSNNAAPSGQAPSAMGFAQITQRDANTLVVQSSHFAPMAWGAARGVSSSAQKRLVERYELQADDLMVLTITLIDPVMLSEPVTVQHRYRKVPGYTFAEEPPCDVATARRHLQFEVEASR